MQDVCDSSCAMVIARLSAGVREPARNRVVEPKLALLLQQQDGRGHELLAGRGNPVARVGAHPDAVHRAVAAVEQHAIALRDEHRAGETVRGVLPTTRSIVAGVGAAAERGEAAVAAPPATASASASPSQRFTA